MVENERSAASLPVAIPGQRTVPLLLRSVSAIATDECPCSVSVGVQSQRNQVAASCDRPVALPSWEFELNATLSSSSSQPSATADAESTVQRKCPTTS